MNLCKFSSILMCKCGRAMAKAVTFRLLTAETPFQSQPSQFGICGGRSDSTLVSRCHVNTPSFHTHSFIHHDSV